MKEEELHKRARTTFPRVLKIIHFPVKVLVAASEEKLAASLRNVDDTTGVSYIYKCMTVAGV